jgi:hypothetical protein
MAVLRYDNLKLYLQIFKSIQIIVNYNVTYDLYIL